MVRPTMIPRLGRHRKKTSAPATAFPGPPAPTMSPLLSRLIIGAFPLRFPESLVIPIPPTPIAGSYCIDRSSDISVLAYPLRQQAIRRVRTNDEVFFFLDKPLETRQNTFFPRESEQQTPDRLFEKRDRSRHRRSRCIGLH